MLIITGVNKETMSSRNNKTNRGNATNRNVAVATVNYVRDSRGRFASPSASTQSKSTTVVKQAKNSVSKNPTGAQKSSSTSTQSKSTTVVKQAKKLMSKNPVKAQKSSFIERMSINENNTIDVVMTRYPKIVYTYKPTKKGLSSVRATLNRGSSLGTAYNTHLRGREISRTIFK